MTDVHFHPSGSSYPAVAAPVVGVTTTAELEATEMAAFEKGRMQGELEAIRRMENEQQLKTFPAEQAVVQRPDVVEINRLTVPQKIAAVLGTASGLAYIVLVIVYAREWRGGFSWSNSYPATGDVTMWNTGLLVECLGLFFLSQAILHYRILPLNLSATFNKINYAFWYSAALTCFAMGLVTLITNPVGANFWAIDQWCYVAALASVTFHGIYSMLRSLFFHRRAVDYETWSETNTNVTSHQWESAEQRRDHSTHNAAGRTVYTPAPVFNGIRAPATNMNMGAQVPAAPANAPRWAENPNTHAEHFFLMPRAKWGVASFIGIGAAILMIFSAQTHVLAAGRGNWAQDGVFGSGIEERGAQAQVLGALGVTMLCSIMLIAYAAMPPRTTLVKNGILSEPRRASISHNADTRLGHNMV